MPGSAAAFACTLLPLSHAARLTAALREAKLESDGALASPPDAARLPLVGRLLRDGDVERRVVDADATQAWCVEWPPPSDGSPPRREALPGLGSVGGLRLQLLLRGVSRRVAPGR